MEGSFKYFTAIPKGKMIYLHAIKISLNFLGKVIMCRLIARLLLNLNSAIRTFINNWEQIVGDLWKVQEPNLGTVLVTQTFYVMINNAFG